MTDIPHTIIGIDFSIKAGTTCMKTPDNIFYIVPGDHYEKHHKNFPSNSIPYDNSSLFNSATGTATRIRENFDRRTRAFTAIEGHSYGSVGRHSDIAEALGRLLYCLESDYPGVTIIRPSPKTIKKFATGDGNATKAQMISAWAKETGNPIQYKYHKRTKVQLGINEDSPWSDIADAYYMMRYAEDTALGLILPTVKVKKPRKTRKKAVSK